MTDPPRMWYHAPNKGAALQPIVHKGGCQHVPARVVGDIGSRCGCCGYRLSRICPCYPASLSAIPYGHELLPILGEGWREQWDLYASILESKLGVFVRGHPMEMAGGYGLIGLFLLLSRGYRDAGWEHCLLVLWYGLFIPILFVLGLIVARWGGEIFQFFGGGESGTTSYDRMRANPISGLANVVGGLVIGVPAMLIGVVIGLVIRVAVYVVPPLYVLFGLFVLPSILFVILRFLVRLPVLTYHYLHYLTVPHKNGMAKGVPLPELARDVARAMYVHDLNIYKRPPPVWKSQNKKKRIEEAEKVLHAGRSFMEEFEKYIRQDERSRDG
jgi:hypothetical protein